MENEEVQKFEQNNRLSISNEYRLSQFIKHRAKELESFQKVIHEAPPANEIQINKFANNSKFLPISFVQMKLDEMFFGLWSERNYRTGVIANEITGIIEIDFLHPVAGVWLTRTGTAAVQIQLSVEYEKDEQGNDVKKDGQKVKLKTDITDISKKIINTLGKDYPHLKASCVVNAAKTIGKMFGRDLSREYFDTYTPQTMIDEAKAEIDWDREKVISLLAERDVKAEVKNSIEKTIGTMKIEDLKGSIIYLTSLPLKGPAK